LAPQELSIDIASTICRHHKNCL